MDITEVRIKLMEDAGERLQAFCSITFDDCFVVRDLKVINGNSGLFVAMPSKKRKDGTFKDVAHPLNNEFRAKIEKAVLDAYEKEAFHEAPEAPPAPAPPPVEAKTPDQINPEDYAAPDD